MPDLLPYRARVFAYAKTETGRYWNSHRTSTAIAAPIITALFWIPIKGWMGWTTIVYSIVLGFLLFFAGWGIVFAVSVIHAPAALDAECQSTIAKLNQKLEFPDKALAEHLTRLLAKISDNGRVFLKFMLLYEHEISWSDIHLCGLEQKKEEAALNECREQGLIKYRVQTHPIHAAVNTPFFWIPDGFRPTLKLLLMVGDGELNQVRNPSVSKSSASDSASR